MGMTVITPPLNCRPRVLENQPSTDSRSRALLTDAFHEGDFYKVRGCLLTDSRPAVAVAIVPWSAVEGTRECLLCCFALAPLSMWWKRAGVQAVLESTRVRTAHTYLDVAPLPCRERTARARLRPRSVGTTRSVCWTVAARFCTLRTSAKTPLVCEACGRQWCCSPLAFFFDRVLLPYASTQPPSGRHRISTSHAHALRNWCAYIDNHSRSIVLFAASTRNPKPKYLYGRHAS